MRANYLKLHTSRMQPLRFGQRIIVSLVSVIFSCFGIIMLYQIVFGALYGAWRTRSKTILCPRTEVTL
jgi:hypothetical protein